MTEKEEAHTCGNCDHYNENVSGPDWGSGKCFGYYAQENKVNMVNGRDTCEKWIEATLYDGDGEPYKALGGAGQ